MWMGSFGISWHILAFDQLTDFGPWLTLLLSKTFWKSMMPQLKFAELSQETLFSWPFLCRVDRLAVPLSKQEPTRDPKPVKLPQEN